jgi:hypothetical protein
MTTTTNRLTPASPGQLFVTEQTTLGAHARRPSWHWLGTLGRSLVGLAAVTLRFAAALILLITQPQWPMLFGVLVLSTAVALAFWASRSSPTRL